MGCAGSYTAMGIYVPAVNELNYATNLNYNWGILDYVLQGWVKPKWTFAYVSTSSFTIVGDKSAYITKGQVIKTANNVGTLYTSVVTAISYSGGSGLTTVTVQDTNVPASLSYALFALVNPTNLASVAYNTLMGYQAGNSITSGNYNVFNGYQAGYSNQAGSNNVNIGYKSGYLLTGSVNTFVGMRSGATTSSGNYNVFLGASAGDSNTVGSNNTNIGFSAGYSSIGSGNTYIGYQAGLINSSGNSNMFLGNNAGYFETGSNKLFIDNASRASEADGRVKALIYGIFDASTTNQSVTINGKLKATVGGSTNHAVCWKSDGALGYCSTVIAADGTCTCN